MEEDISVKMKKRAFAGYGIEHQQVIFLYHTSCEADDKALDCQRGWFFSTQMFSSFRQGHSGHYWPNVPFMCLLFCLVSTHNNSLQRVGEVDPDV